MKTDKTHFLSFSSASLSKQTASDSCWHESHDLAARSDTCVCLIVWRAACTSTAVFFFRLRKLKTLRCISKAEISAYSPSGKLIYQENISLVYKIFKWLKTHPCLWFPTLPWLRDCGLKNVKNKGLGSCRVCVCLFWKYPTRDQGSSASCTPICMRHQRACLWSVDARASMPSSSECRRHS